MIFFTAMTIGIAAGLLRSVTAIALTACLICLSFGLAAAISPAMPSFLSLFTAIAGFNVGLIDLVAGSLLISRLRAA